MGKIRVRTLGEEALEKKQKQESKQKAKEKKLVKGAKGGERIVAVLPTEEELKRQEVPKETKKKTLQPKHTRSKRYKTIAKLVDKTKIYPLQQALAFLPKLHIASFDETVELHINTIDKGISATATLPHGTGKKTRVAIANDEIVENVAKGKIDFDVLLAEPSMMSKLARVAKYLGPRGLMPNPKNGTITTNPKELAKKFEGGQVTFKTESKSPIMHISVGKLSFGAEKLLENIQTVLNAVKSQNIKNATLKSTMSPGIKIKFG